MPPTIRLIPAIPAINAVKTHAKFMALYDTPVDSDGNPTGNAPISDWPDAI